MSGVRNSKPDTCEIRVISDLRNGESIEANKAQIFCTYVLIHSFGTLEEIPLLP